MTEDEMAGWHHRLEASPQGLGYRLIPRLLHIFSLVCYSVSMSAIYVFFISKNE